MYINKRVPSADCVELVDKYDGARPLRLLRREPLLFAGIGALLRLFEEFSDPLGS
jgi:hypothetical protein